MTANQETKRRPILGLTQFLIIVGVVIALGIAVDLNAKARAGRDIGANEARLAGLVAAEEERNRLLKITLTYVLSDDYVADFARDEAGLILPNEKRVVPLLHPPPLTPTPMPTPVPAIRPPDAPWQAWWMLFFDSPPPGG